MRSRRVRPSPLLFGLAVALVLVEPSLAWGYTERAHPTLPWTLVQLVPSPELGVGSRGALFGMRWQLTPALYSFGSHRSVERRWRWFVVEPVTRQSGSIELFFSPETFDLASNHGYEWGFRTGLRSYFPLVHRGEYLSFSLGSGYLQLGSRRSAFYEAGAYVLFGFLGVQVAVVPAIEQLHTVTTLSLRVL